MKDNTDSKPLLPCPFMGKTLRVNPEGRSGVGVPKTVCCCMQHHSGNVCNIISTRRIGLAFLLDYTDAVERVRLMNAQSLPINAQVTTSLYHLIASPVATGKRLSCRCGCTGSCSQEPAHWRLGLYGRSSIWIEAGMEFDSHPSD